MAKNFKLTRDQARSIQINFFPYLVAVCEMKLAHTYSDDELYNNKMIFCLLQEIRIQFEKKLSTVSNKLTFKFSDPQSIILYKLLMNIPIQSDHFWLINLRIFICDILHKQLSEPIIK
jgi:hypothetical protein